MRLFTDIHVLISLAAIFSGFVVVGGLICSRPLDCWTAFFLATTIATSVTGFLFPFHHFMPSHALGIVSLLVLTLALLARYKYRLDGGWRLTYVVTALTALYLNVFVLVAQGFEKIPSLHALAPTQKEPPFALAQGTVLVLFIALGIAAARKFKDLSLVSPGPAV